MLIQNQVGPVAATQSIGAGTLAPMRAGNLGDAIISELHGRYYETTYRRAMFSAANPSAVVTTVGLATTATGLIVTNPIGSSVNLVLTKFGYAFTVVWPAVAVFGLATGFNSGSGVTQTTPITPKNNFVGGASGTGLAASAATLPTASTIQQILGAGLTGAATVQTCMAGFVDLEGSIILTPGSYIQTYTSTISGAAGASFSFTWEEVPV